MKSWGFILVQLLWQLSHNDSMGRDEWEFLFQKNDLYFTKVYVRAHQNKCAFYYEKIYKSCIWISLSENKEGYREYFRINYKVQL